MDIDKKDDETYFSCKKTFRNNGTMIKLDEEDDEM